MSTEKPATDTTVETPAKPVAETVARNLRIPKAIDAAVLKNRFRLEHDKAPETFLLALHLGAKALDALTAEEAAKAAAEYQTAE